MPDSSSSPKTTIRNEALHSGASMEQGKGGKSDEALDELFAYNGSRIFTDCV